MILPFSSSRSKTSLISNCLYCASLTPRAMFSKSRNSASFRSPFIRAHPFLPDPPPEPFANIIRSGRECPDDNSAGGGGLPAAGVRVGRWRASLRGVEATPHAEPHQGSRFRYGGAGAARPDAHHQ